MRRLIAILLLAAFGFPAVAPALELGQTAESHLPACCRRNGAHHCSMYTANPTNAPAFNSICPRFPQPSATSPVGTFAAFSTQPDLFLIDTSVLAPIRRAETQRRISSERSRHKRGPPSVRLS